MLNAYEMNLYLLMDMPHNHTIQTTFSLDSMLINDESTIITEALKTSTTLTKLDASNKKIGYRCSKIVADIIMSMINLNVLNLWNNYIDDNGAIELAHGLQNCRNLTYIDLSDNQIGDNGLHAIANSTKTYSCLAYLNLSHNRITDESAGAILTIIKSNYGLMGLNLSSNKIGIKCITAIRDTINIFHYLLSLDLMNNVNLNDNCVEIIKDIILANNSLVSINLGYSSITENGAKNLHAAIETNETLTNLNLNGTRLYTTAPCVLRKIEGRLNKNLNALAERIKNFIFLIVILAHDRSNKNSRSYFHFLPFDLIIYLVTYLNYNNIGKSKDQQLNCAKFILNHTHEVDVLLKTKSPLRIIENMSLAAKHVDRFRFFKTHNEESRKATLENKEKQLFCQ